MKYILGFTFLMVATMVYACDYIHFTDQNGNRVTCATCCYAGVCSTNCY